MRTCTLCRKHKEDDAFAFKIKSKGRRQPVCRGCKKAYNISWYVKNKSKHKKMVKKNNDRYLALLTDEVRKKKANPCEDCGKSYPYYVMDFDHVSGKKLANVSILVRRRVTLSRLLEEIRKCEVVCANCHRERTFQRK